ncbi:MAG TPA: hypothetical protein VGI91_06860 [Steroidobacteraceae bacterium]|jgi:hypothetical protein
MIPLGTLIVAIAASIVAAPIQAQTPYTAESWTPELVSAAVTSCRAAIIDSATQDYLTRHNLSEKDLPPDFKLKIAPLMEPFLLSCNCLIGKLSKEFPFSEFQASTAKMQERIKEFTAKGGACAAPAGT